MNFDFFDILKDGFKSNTTDDGFKEELDDALKISDKSNKKNNETILEKNEHTEKLITEYRDKIKIERNKLLNEFAKETRENGEMYFIFSKTETFNLYKCEEGKSHEVIKVNLKDVPEGADVNSVLRNEDGKFVLDNQATEYIDKEYNKIVNKYLQEQAEYLDSIRIEGHIYEVVEKGNDRVWLSDETKGDGDVIEEIEFTKELFDKIEEGDKVTYNGGKYII